MSLAVFRAMWLSLARDRGALAMSFILPSLFFAIFAAVFSGADGEGVSLRLAVADERGTEVSTRLMSALTADAAFRPVDQSGGDAEEVRRLVKEGAADLGFIIVADGDPIEDLGAGDGPPFRIVVDPAKGGFAPMLAGQVQRHYFAALPDVALQSLGDLMDDMVEFTPDQDDRLAEIVALARDDPDPGMGLQFEASILSENVAGAPAASQSENGGNAAYYAGAIAVMFLLFSSTSGAVSLLEEKEMGVLDRILAGPAGIAALIDGKFLFLWAQGVAQVTVIFLTAWVLAGVSPLIAPLSWVVTTAVAAGAATGLAILIASACQTRRQAQVLSTIIVLIFSAIGGSMAPRFLMPSFMQSLGWITPNAWAIEAYTGIFWRGAEVQALLAPWFALGAATVLGWAGARLLARRLV